MTNEQQDAVLVLLKALKAIRDDANLPEDTRQRAQEALNKATPVLLDGSLLVDLV